MDSASTRNMQAHYRNIMDSFYTESQAPAKASAVKAEPLTVRNNVKPPAKRVSTTAPKNQKENQVKTKVFSSFAEMELLRRLCSSVLKPREQEKELQRIPLLPIPTDPDKSLKTKQIKVHFQFGQNVSKHGSCLGHLQLAQVLKNSLNIKRKNKNSHIWGIIKMKEQHYRIASGAHIYHVVQDLTLDRSLKMTVVTQRSDGSVYYHAGDFVFHWFMWLSCQIQCSAFIMTFSSKSSQQTRHSSPVRARYGCLLWE